MPILIINLFKIIPKYISFELSKVDFSFKYFLSYSALLDFLSHTFKIPAPHYVSHNPLIPFSKKNFYNKFIDKTQYNII